VAARGNAAADDGAAHGRRAADAGQGGDLSGTKAARGDAGWPGRKLAARHGLGAAVRIGSHFCRMHSRPWARLNAADDAVEMVVMNRSGDW
jgi:hypothetical protein